MTAIDIGLRASVVVLAALAAAAMLHRRSAALRHWVLAAGILSAAAVAPLGVALPAWDLPLSSSAAESPVGSLADVESPYPRPGRGRPGRLLLRPLPRPWIRAPCSTWCGPRVARSDCWSCWWACSASPA